MRGSLPGWVWGVLAVPYIGLLYPPLYNMRDPVLFGFPFFYWYQLAWVPLAAALIYVCFRSVRDDR